MSFYRCTAMMYLSDEARRVTACFAARSELEAMSEFKAKFSNALAFDKIQCSKLGEI